jgi:hypothetical protein
VSYGKEKPVCPKHDESFWQQRGSVRNNHISGFRRFLFVRHLTRVLIFWVASAAFLDAQTSIPNEEESWTAHNENLTTHNNPYRTIESHVKSGNLAVDSKTVEVRGPDGNYEFYFRVETETIQENPTFTRSITRTYNPGLDRNEHLTQITEVDARHSGDVSRVEKTISNAGYDGKFQVKEREAAVITKSLDAQRTQTTVYVPGITGEFVASMQINEEQRQTTNGNLDTRKETSLRDIKGGWQLYEVREQTVKRDDQNRTTDDRLFRRDYVGNISPVSEVVTTETNATGQITSSSQTYSVDIPGSVRDRSLHPLQSSKTVRTIQPDRIVTETQVVRPDPGEKDLNTVFNTTDIVVQGSSGREETLTITARYPDGYPSVVSVERRKSEGQH